MRRMSMEGPRLSKRLVPTALLLGLSLPFFTARALTIPADREVLPNGLVLLGHEQHAVPMVSLRLLVKAGSSDDPRGDEGIAHFTGEMLDRGSRKRTAIQFHEALDSIGASLRVETRKDYTVVDFVVLKTELGKGLSLFADLLTSPSFDEAEIRRTRSQILGAIRADRDDAGKVAQDAFWAGVASGSPYGHKIEGDEAAVKRITRASIVRFYRERYRPNRSILAFVGDVTLHDFKRELERALKDWIQGPAPAEPPIEAGRFTAKTIDIPRNLEQANIVLGHPGIRREDPDYYPVQVMNGILGGVSLSSRLGDAVRVRGGFAYSVSSSFVSLKRSGVFEIAMQTKNETAKDAIRVVLDEMKRFQKGGATDEELDLVKRYLIGSFPLRLDTASRVAAYLCDAEFYELGLDFVERYGGLIDGVARADVERVAKKYLHPENVSIVVVGDPNRIKTKPAS